MFAGRSHPALAEAICERLGIPKGKCELGYFSNGETRVEIATSVRNENVFIIQSGSPHTNDSVIELLVMIAACKGASAKSITAVMPYFPYSRQSKKKTHRGAITAKMIANMMYIAGVNHVITVDLHANQMQGFFRNGVDNLHSEPIISRWIKKNLLGWQEAVVVSKNVGGSKRVTSLADVLKLSFAIISTDRARAPLQQMNLADSIVFFDAIEPQAVRAQRGGAYVSRDSSPEDNNVEPQSSSASSESKREPSPPEKLRLNGLQRFTRPRNVKIASSPLIQTLSARSRSPPQSPTPSMSEGRLERIETFQSARRPSEYEVEEGFHDEKARDVITGRLVHGHIVDDDHPSPALSGMSASLNNYHGPDLDNSADPMMSSFVSTASSFQHPDHALGGSVDAAASSDDDEDRIQSAEFEHTVTLVGNVRGKVVLLMDDIMDRSGSWIAAAETCVKRGGAKQVYCIGIHGLFGGSSLEEMEACDCIDYIVVTNTFPIVADRLRRSKKLIVIDLSNLLSEAIRRNHHGGEHLVV